MYHAFSKALNKLSLIFEISCRYVAFEVVFLRVVFSVAYNDGDIYVGFDTRIYECLFNVLLTSGGRES